MTAACCELITARPRFVEDGTSRSFVNPGPLRIDTQSALKSVFCMRLHQSRSLQSSSGIAKSPCPGAFNPARSNKMMPIIQLRALAFNTSVQSHSHAIFTCTSCPAAACMIVSELEGCVVRRSDALRLLEQAFVDTSSVLSRRVVLMLPMELCQSCRADLC